MNTNKIINLETPIDAQDATTKAYVDAVGFTIAPSTSGNVLTSTGTAWVSAAPVPPPPVPVGTIQMWPTATAPTGYLLCTGTAVSRTTYADLFAVVGTTFGVGNGSTTFNLPNYTNRMPYGTTVGSTGGSADAVVVSHNHTATSTDSGHAHGQTWTNPDDFILGGEPPGAVSNPDTNRGNFNHNTNSGNANITTTVATAGVSGTNANLPPYLGINFIIRT